MSDVGRNDVDVLSNKCVFCAPWIYGWKHWGFYWNITKLPLNVMQIWEWIYIYTHMCRYTCFINVKFKVHQDIICCKFLINLADFFISVFCYIKCMFTKRKLEKRHLMVKGVTIKKALPCYLGLRAGPVRGEGVLPLGQAEVCDHQSVVGDESGRQEMPAQRAIQEPDFTLLGYDTWTRHVWTLRMLTAVLRTSWNKSARSETEHLEYSSCRRGTLCRFRRRNQARRCGSVNQSGVGLEGPQFLIEEDFFFFFNTLRTYACHKRMDPV